MALLAALLFCLPLSSAITFEIQSMQGYVDVYNSMIDKAPDVLKNILGNERVNLDVTRKDGSVFRMGLEIKKARINSTVEGDLSDPTIVITTSEDAISQVRTSKDPIAEFQNQRNLGQIKIQSSNLLTGAKLEALLSSTSVLQFFYNMFFGQKA